MSRLLFRLSVVVALGATAGAVVLSESMNYEAAEVPVERVVRNIEQLLVQRPDDIQLRVNLARVHMEAYVLKRDSIFVRRNDPTGGPYLGWLEANVMPKPKASANEAARQAAQQHLTTAIAIYEDVIARAPTQATARLGYAWSLQEAGLKDRAITAYRDAIRVAWPQENQQKSYLQGFQTITEEAAKYLIPLLDKDRDKAEIAVLDGYRAELDSRKRAITPIAIPLRDGATAAEMVDDSARVLFDLDGTGIPKRWTWITPDAGWLVMDLRGRGRITSALQMFGNVTFWLFWDNGYDAMRTLDDDADGFLRGDELEGLALWRDANQNGVSDPGEVAPLAAWKITELSCRYVFDARHPDEIAFSPNGVRFEDGRTRPTFDLVMHSSPARNTVKYIW
jgi:tetratricopeptide (TPR) repeat protein